MGLLQYFINPNYNVHTYLLGSKKLDNFKVFDCLMITPGLKVSAKSMEKIQDRNVLFDNLKGVTIFSVVLGHAFEYYATTSVVINFIYDLIYSFHMPLFIFIAGYFSKDLARLRNKIFPNLIVPYLIFNSIYVVLLYLTTGQRHFNILIPQFAFWFLISLAFYRGLLVQLIKIKWIIPITIFLGLAAGLNDHIDSFLASSRTISFCWFFLAGYFCTEAHISKIRQFNKTAIMISVIFVLAMFVVLKTTKILPIDFLMNTPYSSGSEVLGLIGRAVAYLFASIFGVAIIAVMPSNNTYFSTIGQRTMIIYLGHGFINGIIRLINPFVTLPVFNGIFLFVFSMGVTLLLSISIFENLYNRMMNNINGTILKTF
jgi:fucose 4-O-acetylase-like acetyltransferase